MVKNGCTWRSLPEKYGKWHTAYMRFNRWTNKGIIQRINEQLQGMQIIDNRTNLLCIDSTFVKVHPDGTGALKKTANRA